MSIDLSAAVTAGRAALVERHGVARSHLDCGELCRYQLDSEATVLAAAPLIIATVREHVAREIEAERLTETTWPTQEAHNQGMNYAAHIARGERP